MAPVKKPKSNAKAFAVIRDNRRRSQRIFNMSLAHEGACCYQKPLNVTQWTTYPRGIIKNPFEQKKNRPAKSVRFELPSDDQLQSTSRECNSKWPLINTKSKVVQRQMKALGIPKETLRVAPFHTESQQFLASKLHGFFHH